MMWLDRGGHSLGEGCSKFSMYVFYTSFVKTESPENLLIWFSRPDLWSITVVIWHSIWQTVQFLYEPAGWQSTFQVLRCKKNTYIENQICKTTVWKPARLDFDGQMFWYIYIFLVDLIDWAKRIAYSLWYEMLHSVNRHEHPHELQSRPECIFYVLFSPIYLLV